MADGAATHTLCHCSPVHRDMDTHRPFSCYSRFCGTSKRPENRAAAASEGRSVRVCRNASFLRTQGPSVNLTKLYSPLCHYSRLKLCWYWKNSRPKLLGRATDLLIVGRTTEPQAALSLLMFLMFPGGEIREWAAGAMLDLYHLTPKLIHTSCAFKSTCHFRLRWFSCWLQVYTQVFISPLEPKPWQEFGSADQLVWAARPQDERLKFGKCACQLLFEPWPPTVTHNALYCVDLQTRLCEFLFNNNSDQRIE